MEPLATISSHTVPCWSAKSLASHWVLTTARAVLVVRDWSTQPLCTFCQEDKERAP